MSRNRVTAIQTLAFSALCLALFTYAAPAGSCQAAEPTEKMGPHQHGHAHQMNLPSGVTDKCGPKYTYDDGPLGPDHWEGVCRTGHSQSPIDITKSEKMTVPPLSLLQFHYQAADLDMVNDCNRYVIKVRFPENMWLKVARKPYRLSEIDFREPGENAIAGKRPPMSLEFVHLSPEATFLIIEVPVVVGKENSVIKTLWEHIPKPGKERTTAEVKVNAMDLLPADHGFYTFRGSLTSPQCNEGVIWYVMKSPIEMSQTQIDQYKKYYHNTARALQPVNERPVIQSQ